MAGTYKSTARRSLKKTQKAKKRAEALSAIWRWTRRVVLALGAVLVILSTAAWFFLSDLDTKSAQWVQDRIFSVTSDMGFVVEEVLVEGLVHADPDILKAVINIQKGDPLFSFNPAQARVLVERISWIKTARVERRFPSTIYINVVERVPLAFWQKKGKLKLLDEQGVVITSERLSRFENLIIVIGEEAPSHAFAMIEALKEQKILFDRAKSASWVGARRWNLMFKPNIEVKLPEGDVAPALERLSQAQVRDKILDKDIKGIDLREEGRIVVRTKPGRAHDYKKGSRI